MKIELTEKQKVNLMAFLQRTTLSGAEVPAFIEIVSLFNKEEEKTEDLTKE